MKVWRRASKGRWWLFSYFKIGYEERRRARNSTNKDVFKSIKNERK